MTRAILPLATLWMLACIPDPAPQEDMGTPDSDMGTPKQDLAVFEDWEASTWRGQATLPETLTTNAGDHPAMLSLDDEGTGLLIISLGEKGALGYPTTVARDGTLALGDLTCSGGLSSGCADLSTSLATTRIEAFLNVQTLNLKATALNLELERDDWRNAPHDGFRPQEIGWPPCLAINPFTFMPYGDWDGRVLTLPEVGWSDDPIIGAHCSWAHTERGYAGLRCSPAALFDDFEDPKAFELPATDVTFDEEASTMRATFTQDGVTWVLDGVMSFEDETPETAGYATRKYRWRGVLRRDALDVGTFTFHTWGNSETWTTDELMKCAME